MIEIAIFAAKAAVIVIGVALIAILIMVMISKASHRLEFEVEPLHHRYKDLGLFLKSFTLNKEERKAEKKKLKQEKKQSEKKAHDKKVFVVNFKGGLHANEVDNLREEITSILQLATPHDEVVVCLESPGGVVHGYGLGASQLLRIRQRNIPLTVCVDKVAASGGYLMSCVANRILAAPFAIIGSIGVVAQVPNLHRLLKKLDVDYKEYTAGEFKRTVSLLGEITSKGEQKFQEQIETTHLLFKDFVQSHRPQINLAQVATGEYWYGEQARSLGLIDEITTSDDYLLKKFSEDIPIYKIKYEVKQKLLERLSDFLGKASANAISKILEKLDNQKFL